MIEETVHKPVMLRQVLSNLQADRGGSFLDCTLGGAGHTQALLSSNADNCVLAVDRDANAVQRAQKLVNEYSGRLLVSQATFSELSKRFAKQKFSGIIADLGLSSDQLHEERGFSFNDKSPLDMRMNQQQELSAASVVNDYDFNKLYRILKAGGVGKFGKAITAAIVKARPIDSTSELTDCIHRTVGSTDFGNKNKDSATIVFQAIRMEVNQELSELEALLDFVATAVLPGGRFVAISFHSLEDTLVTKRLRSWSRAAEFSALCPGPEQLQTQRLGCLLTKKALVPESDEVNTNPRSRSARMRVFEFF